jgi:hypothetical protein
MVHPTSCYGANNRHKVRLGAMENASTIKRIAFLGDYLPRQCGIATFTSDICEAVAAQYRECQCVVGAVNDRSEGYDYPAQVRFEIDEKELDSYRRAADFLNINDVEVVSVQHEFGIYGGPAGSHLLASLRDVHMPVVTTLHTLLRDPNLDQRTVMKQLDMLSTRFIVMAERGKHFLEAIYGIASEKIDGSRMAYRTSRLSIPTLTKINLELREKPCS